ncbi:hypothetical protein PLICRDRAFT_39428 [Plicaturopsis crispa FD-325 SS-3]|nr:hypothetical protein PLICRDRAFT_39428 [Plicaturopsis crispa FD-325 SS-3]
MNSPYTNATAPRTQNGSTPSRPSNGSASTPSYSSYGSGGQQVQRPAYPPRTTSVRTGASTTAAVFF